jgi:GAF domain-containing protein
LKENKIMTNRPNCYSCESILIEKLTVPVPYDEGARLSVLQETHLLDSDLNDPEFDRFTAMVKRLFHVPIALISLIDADRQWFKSCIGLPVYQTHRNSAFCSYTVLPSSEDVMVVLDAEVDDRFKDNPLVKGAPYIRFYAG